MKNIKKVCYIPWIGTPLKDEVFKNDKLGNWEYALKQALEKSGIEIHTVDQLPVKDADAVIMFDNMFYRNIPYIWEMYQYKKLDKCVYIDYEPPTGHCRNHSKKGLKKLSHIFKYVITYNDDLVNKHNIIKGCIGNFYSKDFEYKHDFKDRKFITMVTNPTSMEQIIGIMNYFNFTTYYNKKNLKNHPKAIYSKRIDVARYFLEKCPDEFDLYGVHWDNEFNKVLKGYLDKKDKCATLSKYKFIISYDSMIKQNGYISEKIFDAFRAKTIPIYWGANNVSQYIPEECYIDRRKFASYDELYEFLKGMTEEEYERRIKAIEDFLQSEKYKTIFSSEASSNIIIKALFTNRDDFSYKKAYKNLCYFNNKKKKVDKYKKIQYWLSDVESTGNNIKIDFKFMHFFKRDKIELYVKENGEFYKIENAKIFMEENIELSDTYTFTYEVNNTQGKSILEVFLKCNDKMQKIRTEDFSDARAKTIGLIQNRQKNKIIYYNYYNSTKIQKIIYLLKHDRKKIIYKVKTRIREYIYKTTLKIKEKTKSYVILNKILKILFRLVKLPYLYLTDIIDIFKFDNKER